VDLLRLCRAPGVCGEEIREKTSVWEGALRVGLQAPLFRSLRRCDPDQVRRVSVIVMGRIPMRRELSARPAGLPVEQFQCGVCDGRSQGIPRGHPGDGVRHGAARAGTPPHEGGAVPHGLLAAL